MQSGVGYSYQIHQANASQQAEAVGMAVAVIYKTP